MNSSIQKRDSTTPMGDTARRKQGHLDGNNGEREKELQLELETLKKKEQELIEALDGVNSALSDLGLPSSLIYSIDEDATKMNRTALGERQQKIKASGLFDPRQLNSLSFRGEDKAREHFQLLDLNYDGYIGYKEFREINSFAHPYGLIQDPAYQSDIAWKIMMLNDGYSLDLVNPSGTQLFSSNQMIATASTGGGTTTSTLPDEPQVSIEEYVKYRQALEQKGQQSLVPELEAFGMSLLPNYLLEWKKVKALISEVVEVRPFVKTFTKEDLIKLKGLLTLDEMLYIVNILGFNFTKPEFALLMLWRHRKANVLVQLLRFYAKRNLSQQEYSFEIHPKDASLLVEYEDAEAAIIVDSIIKVREEEFIAWFLACPKFITFEKLWYRKILKWKSWFFRGLRTVDSYCRYLFHLAGHINDRLLLRDFLPIQKLSKYLSEIILWKTSVDIGNFELNPLTSERFPGISLSWKLLKLENPETLLKSYHPPPGSSTMIICEFLLKTPMAKEKQELLVDCLRSCLMQTIEKELKTMNPNFNGLQYACLVNEIDENFVLRIMISYKKVVNIDRYFEHILLEYRLSDLITSWMGDIKTNINISNYLQHHLSNFNDTVSIQFTSTIALRKNLIMAIVKRLILAFSAGLTEEQVNILNNPNSPLAEDNTNQKMMTETEKQKIQSTSSSMKRKDRKTSNLKSLASVTATAKHKKGRVQVVTKNQQLEQEEAQIRFQRWKQFYPYYNTMKEWLEGLYANWSTTQTAIVRYSFKNLADLRQKLAILLPEIPWLHSWLSSSSTSANNISGIGMSFDLYHWLSDQLLYEKGYFYRIYTQFQTDFQYEIGTLFNALTRYLEQRKQDDDERRYRELITLVPSDNANQIEHDYMKKQLLQKDGNGKDDEDDLDNPLDYIEELEIKQCQADINNLRLYELCKEYIIGINTIDVISGKNKLSISISDFDPMEIWPVIHSLTANQVTGVREGEGKKTTTGSKEKRETMEQIFRRTTISRNKASRTSTADTANTKGGSQTTSDNALLNLATSFGNF